MSAMKVRVKSKITKASYRDVADNFVTETEVETYEGWWVDTVYANGTKAIIVKEDRSVKEENLTDVTVLSLNEFTEEEMNESCGMELKFKEI
jgi:hypothetical protein